MFFIACPQDGQKSINKKIGKLKLFNIFAKTVNSLKIVSFAVIYWIIGILIQFSLMNSVLRHKSTIYSKA